MQCDKAIDDRCYRHLPGYTALLVRSEQKTFLRELNMDDIGKNIDATAILHQTVTALFDIKKYFQ